MEKGLSQSFKELLKKKKYKQVLELADSQNAFEELINTMSDNFHYKIAIGFVKDKGLNLDSFPELANRARKKYVRYLISFSDDWEQTELQLIWDKGLLAIYSEDLFFKSTCQNPEKQTFKGKKAKQKPFKNEKKTNKKQKEPESIFEKAPENCEEVLEIKNLQISEKDKPANEISGQNLLNFRDLALSVVDRHSLQEFVQKKELRSELGSSFSLIQNRFLSHDSFSLLSSLLRAHKSPRKKFPDACRPWNPAQ